MYYEMNEKYIILGQLRNLINVSGNFDGKENINEFLLT